MPSKTDVLSLFKKDDLLSVAASLGVELSGSKDAMVEALAKQTKEALAGALAGLVRDDLKAVCRKLDLDDSGKHKAPIAARLLGLDEGAVTAVPARAEAPAQRGRPPKASKSNGNHEPITLPSDGKLSVDQLERYLWSAADILRGSIDSSDYKNYIFGLLFLKRLSDVFEEEARKLVAEGLSEKLAYGDPDEHRFFVPPRARWSSLQTQATGIGEALNKACMALEEQNSSLEGVLAGIDYNDERKLGDARNRDTVLHRLVQHFSQLDLRNDRLSEPDMLGRAYEYLIEKFADDAGKKGGEFYTPHGVVKLIVEMLAPTQGLRICDPTCGSGGMLVECASYVANKGASGAPSSAGPGGADGIHPASTSNAHTIHRVNLTLHGQEKNLGTWAICKMNMLLHGLSDARIEKGDTIRNPRLVEGGELLLYDRVIANPPFSLDEWGRETAEADGFGRFRFGIPPKTKGDLAFVQHMVATLNGQGRLGVVMPHGVLFRGAAEGEIRKGMLQEDLFEAVIGLAPNLFYGTGIPAAILVINRSKDSKRRGKVLFIDASSDMDEGSAQNYLREQHVTKIAAAFHAYKDVERYARVVGLDEIEKNEFNLNISRYVDTSQAEEKIDVAVAVARLRELEAERAEAEAKMNGYLKELGYGD
ncbi:MAG: class I SAM-dependent DNA methyltransferase [Pseudomonadota bacterium]